MTIPILAFLCALAGIFMIAFGKGRASTFGIALLAAGLAVVLAAIDHMQHIG